MEKNEKRPAAKGAAAKRAKAKKRNEKTPIRKLKPAGAELIILC